MRAGEDAGKIPETSAGKSRRTWPECVRGSAEGTTVMERASIHLPVIGTSIHARLPGLISGRREEASVATMRSDAGSNPVMSGLPGVAISPSCT